MRLRLAAALAGAVGAFTGPGRLVDLLIGSVFVAGVMAVCLVIYKGRTRQTIRNIGHILVSLVTFQLPGDRVSLDNPDSLKVPYGVALAFTVVLYGIYWEGSHEMRSGEQSMLRLLARLAWSENASEIAEAAAVLPLMFTVLLGIFWFGQAFSTYGTITRAAQEGARAGAAASACTTCGGGAVPASNAYTAVQNVLTVAKLDPLIATAPAPPPALLACNTGAAVSCAGPSPTHVCVQMNVQLTVRAGGGVGVCGVSVSFQYPFKFWLPFTSLNKQQVLLNASARVRSETH